MDPTTLNFIETGAAIAIFFLLQFTALRLSRRALKKFGFSHQRRKGISKIVNFILVTVLVLVIMGVWGLGGSQVLVYITSVLAFVGVALFAQWSILSNLTAGIVLYFNHPLKLGDHIRVVDKDIPIEGEVEDITMYFLHIRTSEGLEYTIPNNLALQKVISMRVRDLDDD